MKHWGSKGMVICFALSLTLSVYLLAKGNKSLTIY